MGVQDMMTTLNLSVGVLHAIDCSDLALGERFGHWKWKIFTQLSRFFFFLMIIYFNIGIRESKYLGIHINFSSSFTSWVIQSLWTSLKTTASISDFQLLSADSLPYLLFNLYISLRTRIHVDIFQTNSPPQKTWFLISKFLNLMRFQ